MEAPRLRVLWFATRVHSGLDSDFSKAVNTEENRATALQDGDNGRPGHVPSGDKVSLQSPGEPSLRAKLPGTITVDGVGSRGTKDSER